MLHKWRMAGLLALIMAFAVPLTIGSAQDIAEMDSVMFGYTYQRADGNRWIAGRGALPNAPFFDLALDGSPAWLVAAPLGDTASVWVAVLDNGRVQAFRIEGAEAAPITITPEQLPPGMPPLLMVRDGVPSLVVAPPEIDAAPFTHPLVVDDAGTLAVIGADGRLLLVAPDETVDILADRPISPGGISLLPDSRLIWIADDTLLGLTMPTNAYPHGALGDGLEAGGALVINLTNSQRDAGLGFGGGSGGTIVSEMITPMAADLNGDGANEALFTVTDATFGARVRVVPYGDEGFTPPVDGPAIGTGFRWRHQIAVAPFGPNGEMELAVIRTPHIGGIAEFYQFDGETVEIVATLGGYTSHSFGSRNLDRAAAGDFDGDGRVELLVEAFDTYELVAIRRSADGAEEAWRISPGGSPRTNLAGVTLPDGRMMLGVGRGDGILRVWLPDGE